MEQTRGPMNKKPDEEAYGAGRASKEMGKPISIKGTGGKSGGRAGKAVELIAGDLLYVAEL